MSRPTSTDVHRQDTHQNANLHISHWHNIVLSQIHFLLHLLLHKHAIWDVTVYFLSGLFWLHFRLTLRLKLDGFKHQDRNFTRPSC